jgi:hypothetical protein
MQLVHFKRLCLHAAFAKACWRFWMVCDTCGVEPRKYVCHCVTVYGSLFVLFLLCSTVLFCTVLYCCVHMRVGWSEC